MKKSDIIDQIKKSGTNKIKLAVSDIDGILRGKILHIDKFIEIAESDFGFCDVVFGWDAADAVYDNTTLTGWHTGYPDARARLDLDTLRTIPWDGGTPFILADFSTTSGPGHAACPRNLLKQIRQQSTDMGFRAIFSMEFEWFNFLGTPSQLAGSNYQNLNPLSPGMFGYSITRPTLNKDYFNALFDQLAAFDIPIEGLHTETGPGVYEAAIRYDEVLRAADKAILFKTGVKEIASQFGIIASFMAKWNAQLPGCSGHLHQSLWDLKEERNLFFDPNNHPGMSQLMKSYIAGQLACLPEILPMYAPNINSYKRLRDGAWAPTTLTWGLDNRTTAIRVINQEEKSTRIEMRVPGSDANPYLAMAASLASGLYGISKGLSLDTPPSAGNGYLDKENGSLPPNLFEATQKMKSSSIARELFGDTFVDHFTATREWEWREFFKEVTNWEIKRYFEII